MVALRTSSTLSTWGLWAMRRKSVPSIVMGLPTSSLSRSAISCKLLPTSKSRSRAEMESGKFMDFTVTKGSSGGGHDLRGKSTKSYRVPDDGRRVAHAAVMGCVGVLVNAPPASEPMWPAYEHER